MNTIADFFQRLFDPVVNVLGTVLLYLHQDFLGTGLPWWLAISVLTIGVRTLLFPLTIKQVRSMRAMQDLRPEMDRIRAQYKDNRTKQQEEIMKLYQERKVNPLGGCLPILIQMPIFMGFFYVIRQFGGYTIGGKTVPPAYPSFHDGGILWFQNLSVMDPFYILPVVSALTMLAATEITAKNVDPQQRWMMRILPLGITFFLYKFPAGLFVYWITSNLVTLVQNYLIYHHGPGRRSKDADEAKLKDGQRAQPGNSEKGRSENASKNGSSGGEGSRDAVAAQSARAAKRKRRKKKK